MRIKAVISYDGSKFAGFQKQKNIDDTVATRVDKALKGFNIETKIVASGRTDRGVHALGQVIHFDVPRHITNLPYFKKRLNRNLDGAIHFKGIVKADDTFHARFCAKSRVYRYIISQKNTNPFLNPYVSYVDFDIDIKRLAKDIKIFEGIHDFRYFKKSGSNSKNNILEIKKAFAYRYKEFIVLSFEGSSFLRSQIRIMSHFLLELNRRKIKKLDILKQFKEMHLNIKLAPPNGLYLVRVKY